MFTHCQTQLNFNGHVYDLLKLFRQRRNVFVLESSLFHNEHGRYSLIGFDPFDTFSHTGKDSLDLLKQKFLSFKEGWKTDVTPLPAGIVGYIGYDYGLYQEKIVLKSRKDLTVPDCFFGFYDCVITVDHLLKKMHIISTGLPEVDPVRRRRKAEDKLQWIKEQIENMDHSSIPAGEWPKEEQVIKFQSNFSKQDYCRAVRKALNYIERGDIYQVNLSQRFEFDLTDIHLDPIELYGLLSHNSPSMFNGYLDGGLFQMISNSPERFLSLQGSRVQTRPMKGTRPRAQSRQEDDALRNELIHSPKEIAELLMITDLERNDIGKVCEFGSVRVTEQRTIEEYKTVFQATSTVEGVLRKSLDGFDLLKACFPGGSITGCPKIRSMEIIEELEPTRRGIYTGALGYMNFSGDMDFNILIRTLLHQNKKLYCQVGAGIVADSLPEAEYEETLVKAKAIKSSLAHALCPSQSFI